MDYLAGHMLSRTSSECLAETLGRLWNFREATFGSFEEYREGLPTSSRFRVQCLGSSKQLGFSVDYILIMAWRIDWKSLEAPKE